MTVRHDFAEILRLVRPGARVLDVGCGSGELLDLLRREKRVDGRGLELAPESVAACLAKGLAVMQGDADRDLGEFGPDSFDYVILSQTLQAVREPRKVLSDLLRLSQRAVVSFPNFGHWRVRLSLAWRGRMPETRALPDPWWATANIHLCTLADFTALAAELGLEIEAAAAVFRDRPAAPIDPRAGLANLRAEQALLLLRRGAQATASTVPREVALPSPTGDLFG